MHTKTYPAPGLERQVVKACWKICNQILQWRRPVFFQFFPI